jgi:electron transport complex protein RnfA
MSNLLSIFIGMAFVNNIVLVQFLGLCPIFGTYKKTGTAINMCIAVSLVLFVSSIIAWLSYKYVLVPLNAEYLNLLMYLLIISLLVQAISVFFKRTSEKIYKTLGVYVVLISNCAVLGVLLLNASESYSLLESMVAALGAGVGFTLVMAVMSEIREKLEIANSPKAMKGLPLVFITAGLLAMAFSGLAGI